MVEMYACDKFSWFVYVINVLSEKKKENTMLVVLYGVLCIW